ncbi:hypothetical protein [Streptomyces sp. NPDC056796]|uniref:hypothetical protein n=1 Tax=Streptomyces sp. NPDC056796 TaxID=3345947 RepID=UPI0036D07F98
MQRRVMTLFAVVVSLFLLSTAPSYASETVGWKPVATTSNWSCGAYISHDVRSAVRFRACIVTNASGGAQTVLWVENKSTAYDEYIDQGRVVFESQLGGDVWCKPSNLAYGGTAGCYAPTVPVGKCSRTTSATVELKIQGVTRSATAAGQYTPC